MERKFTLAELVKKYGSEAIKRSFKKNGNISGKELITLKNLFIRYGNTVIYWRGEGLKEYSFAEENEKRRLSG